MTASTSVKWAVSSMVGAPTLNGTAGSLIALLDAFLVHGFGTKAVDSAVVTNGICRMNITGASGVQEHCVIQLSGVTGDGAVLNGEQRVKAFAAAYVEFVCDMPDGPLTGTITFKIAALGWDKVFSGTNLAVYRSADVAGTLTFLRVDDSAGRNARMVAYEAMDSVDVGRKPFPTESQLTGGVYLPKSNAADGNARAWSLFGDSNTLYIHTHTASARPLAGGVWTFGDFESLRSGDAYCAMLQGALSDLSNDNQARSEAVEHFSAAGGASAFVVRSYTGLGSSVNCGHGAESHATASGASGAVSNAAVPNYPNGPDNSLVLTRKVLFEQGVALRGFYRGLLVTPQQCHNAFAHGDVFDGTGRYAGRKLMAVKCGGVAGNSSRGVVFFDITGPWG